LAFPGPPSRPAAGRVPGSVVRGPRAVGSPVGRRHVATPAVPVGWPAVSPVESCRARVPPTARRGLRVPRPAVPAGCRSRHRSRRARPACRPRSGRATCVPRPAFRPAPRSHRAGPCARPPSGQGSPRSQDRRPGGWPAALPAAVVSPVSPTVYRRRARRPGRAGAGQDGGMGAGVPGFPRPPSRQAGRGRPTGGRWPGRVWPHPGGRLSHRAHAPHRPRRVPVRSGFRGRRETVPSRRGRRRIGGAVGVTGGIPTFATPQRLDHPGGGKASTIKAAFRFRSRGGSVMLGPGRDEGGVRDGHL
jgi:hypothetical protein